MANDSQLHEELAIAEEPGGLVTGEILGWSSSGRDGVRSSKRVAWTNLDRITVVNYKSTGEEKQRANLAASVAQRELPYRTPSRS